VRPDSAVQAARTAIVATPVTPEMLRSTRLIVRSVVSATRRYPCSGGLGWWIAWAGTSRSRDAPGRTVSGGLAIGEGSCGMVDRFGAIVPPVIESRNCPIFKFRARDVVSDSSKISDTRSTMHHRISSVDAQVPRCRQSPKPDASGTEQVFASHSADGRLREKMEWWLSAKTSNRVAAVAILHFSFQRAIYSPQLDP
jgi:hypothetical protein